MLVTYIINKYATHSLAHVVPSDKKQAEAMHNWVNMVTLLRILAWKTVLL